MWDENAVLSTVPVTVPDTVPSLGPGRTNFARTLIPCLCPAACSRCRHAAIAKYFGDVRPTCTRGCDHCQNPAAVQKQLDALEQRSSWSKTCIGPSQRNGFDPELYEGGRRGARGFSR